MLDRIVYHEELRIFLQFLGQTFKDTVKMNEYVCGLCCQCLFASAGWELRASAAAGAGDRGALRPLPGGEPVLPNGSCRPLLRPPTPAPLRAHSPQAVTPCSGYELSLALSQPGQFWAAICVPEVRLGAKSVMILPVISSLLSLLPSLHCTPPFSGVPLHRAPPLLPQSLPGNQT